MTDHGSRTTPENKKLVWAGRVVSALPALMLTMSAVFKLTADAEMIKMFTEGLGFPASTLVPIGIVELACVILYVIPQTATLGAVLITGYLGGAVVTHVRMADSFLNPLIFGVLAWLGLWLRDARLRSLLPLRRL